MYQLPDHLKKYIVNQEEINYTSKEHSIWRYILRQLKDFLKDHAYEGYLEGLQKTGITTEEIPRIKDISRHLEKFGWRALPVSGFIPPAAFMELQSLSILPIASEIRSLDHLKYTPAPDIVHEAAGHAPFLANPEFAAYLKKYSTVAKKAIMSKEDLEVYEAIRILSDIKENPLSTKQQTEAAEKKLVSVVEKNKTVSEAAELGRMNWWTAEYGLIGDLNNPKIFGAGLLSSVGESHSCLEDKVKKIPLSIECLKYSYDITEQQPQLFVTPSFKYLETVLNQMAEQMAFITGGVKGLEKAQISGTVNTIELNSGLQISGILSGYEHTNGAVDFVQFSSPTQMAIQDSQIDGHDKHYHAAGFSSPLGKFKNNDTCPCEYSDNDWLSLGLEIGKKIILTYANGFIVQGIYYGRLIRNHRTLIMNFKDASVTKGSQVYYKPEWGPFDLVLGSTITSVFSGPADRVAYGQNDDFVVKKVAPKTLTDNDRKINQVYTNIRHLRTEFNFETPALPTLKSLYLQITEYDSKDWLAVLEIYEILVQKRASLSKESNYNEFLNQIRNDLETKRTILTDSGDSIHQGLQLAMHP